VRSESQPSEQFSIVISTAERQTGSQKVRVLETFESVFQKQTTSMLDARLHLKGLKQISRQTSKHCYRCLY
jgi:hypothetical protein